MAESRVIDRSRSGLWFEQFKIGDVFITPSRTVTEADNAIYCGLSGDYNPLHTDEVFASKTQFGTRIAAGLLGRMVLSGLITRLGFLEGTAVANLELASWRFVGPILFGDTLRGEIRVLDTKLTSSASRGVVTFEMTVKNHRDELVQQGIQKVMVHCEPQEGESNR